MKTRFIVIGLVLMFAITNTAAAGDDKSSKDFTKHPGYVDFEELEIFSEEKANVEVYLKQPMLKLVSEFTKNEDPELYDVMKKLALVRVNVFEATREFTEKFKAQSSRIIKKLDDRGWERVVRVREDDEYVNVYLKPSGDNKYIQGIVILVVEEGDEAVFVNIVGDIHPEEISRLGELLDVDELDSIRSVKLKTE
jgi:hypothetical protein